MRYKISVLGENVYQSRVKQRLTQRDVANAAGIYHVTLSRLERGEVQDLKGATVSRIADKLGVSMDFLYGRTKERNATEISYET